MFLTVQEFRIVFGVKYYNNLSGFSQINHGFSLSLNRKKYGSFPEIRMLD